MRYSKHGYEEILSEDGKLVGINFGFSFCAEHEHGYAGLEQQKKVSSVNISNKNFEKEIIKISDRVKIFTTSTGIIVLTNDDFYFQINQLDLDEIVELYINKNRHTEFLERGNSVENALPYAAFWNENKFIIISKDNKHNEKLKYLYDEIQKGNVALSSDFSMIFKDRGLSFVCLDKLTKKDNLKKIEKDNYENQLYLFQEEMNNYLKAEGFEFNSKEYPVHPFNVQINNIITNMDGEIIPQFYAEFYDERENNKADKKLLNAIPNKLTDKEIEFLIKIIKSEEFNLLSQEYATQEINQCLSKKISNYRHKSGGSLGNKSHR